MGWFRSSTSPASEPAPTLEERLAGIGPGVPGHCPSCDGLGYIDNLDIGHRFQIQHCKDCAHRWEYLFDVEGHVVGLTELDEEGQPVARTRVRRQAGPSAPVVEAGGEVADIATPEPEPEPEPELVVDLREPAPSPGPHEEDAGQLSPAEWLRQAVRR